MREGALSKGCEYVINMVVQAGKSPRDANLSRPLRVNLAATAADNTWSPCKQRSTRFASRNPLGIYYKDSTTAALSAMMPAYDELLMMMIPDIVSAVLTFDGPLVSFEDYYKIVYMATILYRGDASVHCREMLLSVSNGIAMAVNSYNGTDEALMMFQVIVWVPPLHSVPGDCVHMRGYVQGYGISCLQLANT